MYVFEWIIQQLKVLWNGFLQANEWWRTFWTNLWHWMVNGDRSLFNFVGDTLSLWSDRLWDKIQEFNIFGDFGVSALYGWIPDTAVTSALTYMFTFLCLIGSLKLLKKILPFW